MAADEAEAVDDAETAAETEAASVRLASGRALTLPKGRKRVCRAGGTDPGLLSASLRTLRAQR